MRAALSRLAYLGGTARTCEVTFSLGVRKKGIECANAMFRLLPRNCASGVGFATGAAILRCCAGSGEETRVRGGGVTPTPLSCSSEWARPAWLEVVGRSESGRPVFLFFFFPPHPPFSALRGESEVVSWRSSQYPVREKASPRLEFCGVRTSVSQCFLSALLLSSSVCFRPKLFFALTLAQQFNAL